MDKNFSNEYFEKLYKASNNAFQALFKNEEHFYYCTLTITGDGLTPVISAWSHEALDRKCNGDEEERYAMEWSYADSPYYAWEYDTFCEVTDLLASRPKMLDMSDEVWENEIAIRLDGMEKVMRKLDEDGIFSVNQKREDVVICAEIMPPDRSNTERVSRLNKKEMYMFRKWLKEAAE